MLARLDDELAPARSQTDREGRYLRVVDVPDGAGDVVPRVREIVRELGHEVEPLTAGDPVPDDWYDKETIRELSVHEADTITETWLSEFARQAGLDADRERALKDLSRRTLVEIFDRWRAVRRAPSPGEAVDELRAGVAAVLAPSEAEALGAWLAAKAASLDEHGQADGPRVSLRVSRDHDETGGLGMDEYTRAAEMTAQLTQKGGVLDYGPERSRLLVRVLRTLALGSPVTSPDVEALAHEAGLTPPEAQAFLRQVTERDAADRIIGVLGLSLGAHPHRFSVNGQRLSTWCAEDTLFLPALLGETATVESTSPISREPVRLTIGPEGVQAVSPAGAVVSIALVDPDQTPFQSVEAIWMTFCRHIYFFASREEAERWAAGRRDIAILTPHEGYRIGRQLADRFLAVAA